MQELTIKDILIILKKRWWMIVAFCILMTAIAGMYFNSQPNEYTAQATLYVLLNYVDSQGQIRFDVNVGEQFSRDFKELLKTNTIMEKTLDSLGIQKEELLDTVIEINTITGTRLLNISATGQSADMSVKVANTVSEVFIEYIQELITTNAATKESETKLPDVPSTVRIVSEASLPDTASGPNRPRNTLLAAAVSLMLAIGVTLAIEMLNTTLRSADTVERDLGLPVLASIQSYKKEISRFLQNHALGEMLSECISMSTKECVKTLAANVQFATIANPTHTLIVTSSIASEGKSSLLLLLGDALADQNKRVLLVDMDMRSPSLHKYIGSRSRFDLFDYLVGHSRLEEVICKTGNPGIHFIDSRHHLASVSQIVNYEVFDRFLDTVKRCYDFVLFDTPPLSLFIDAAALANKMDAALLVVGNGMTDRSVAAEVVNQLHKASVNILGAVLNFMDLNKGHEQYYGKAYGSEKKEKANASKKKTKDM